MLNYYIGSNPIIFIIIFFYLYNITNEILVGRFTTRMGRPSCLVGSCPTIFIIYKRP